MYFATRYFHFLQEKRGIHWKKGQKRGKKGRMPHIRGAPLKKGHSGNPVYWKLKVFKMFNNNRYIKYVFLSYFDYRLPHDFKFLKHPTRPLYSYVYGQQSGGIQIDFKRNGGHKLIFSNYYLHLLYSLQTMFSLQQVCLLLWYPKWM